MVDKPQVVKLAQSGIDVKTAGDENLVYNSNWPLLKIYKQGSFTTTALKTPGQIVVNHDLGYVPMYYWFSNNTRESSLGNTPVATNSRSNFFGEAYTEPVITNKSLVYNADTTASGVGSDRFYYYIFALDITKPYKAPIIKSGGVIGPRNTKTAFKLAKAGKDIRSASLDDYIVNSDARSPLVHAVAILTTSADGSVAGYGASYQHDLGYVPMFFAYVKTTPGGPYGGFNPIGDAWELLLVADPATTGFTVDDKKISYTNVYNNLQISLVILKDPVDIDYIIPVNI